MSSLLDDNQWVPFRMTFYDSFYDVNSLTLPHKGVICTLALMLAIMDSP